MNAGMTPFADLKGSFMHEGGCEVLHAPSIGSAAMHQLLCNWLLLLTSMLPIKCTEPA